VVPEGVEIGFTKARNLEIALQRAAVINMLRNLRERRVVDAAIFLHVLDPVLQKLRHILPLMLFEHWDAGPATPAIECLGSCN
jgi:hypothetical protein